MNNDQQVTVKLVGVVGDRPAKQHEYNKVDGFMDAVSLLTSEDTPEFEILLHEDDSAITLITKRDRYELPKHPTLNIYCGECNGTKVHVSLKKLVGKLIYWIQ